jgi:hypothetical protein
MRHQDRHHRIFKDVTCRSAKDHLAQAALGVGSLDEEIAADRGRVVENNVARVHALLASSSTL